MKELENETLSNKQNRLIIPFLNELRFKKISGHNVHRHCWLHETQCENEAQAIELIQWQRKTIKPLVVKHEGQWLKEIGDGLLLSFPSSLNAVECAVQIQENFNDSNFKIRIGIHQGDVIIEGNDIFGDGVNLASRIEPLPLRGNCLF